jgi:hypothetical protein
VSFVGGERGGIQVKDFKNADVLVQPALMEIHQILRKAHGESAGRFMTSRLGNQMVYKPCALGLLPQAQSPCRHTELACDGTVS